MKSTINFLWSVSFVFVALLILMLAQMTIAAFIHYANTPLDYTVNIGGNNVYILKIITSLFYAIAIESSVLIFIINGNKEAGAWYGLGSFVISIIAYGFYKDVDISVNIDPFEVNRFYLPAKFVSTTIMAAMMSGAQWYYSDLFVSRINKDEDEEKYKCRICGKLHKNYRELNGHLAAHKKENKISESLL
jgi:hypothetical protein